MLGENLADGVPVDGFALGAASVFIGETIPFSFTIEAQQETGARLEYGIDYVKANGKRSRKIFHISETSLKGNGKKWYTKKHSFADASDSRLARRPVWV